MVVLLKLGLPLSLIFMGAIGLIRARPYDDAELRGFLNPPEACPAPCFMGIRPDVTRTDEVLAALESHAWVERAFLVDTDIPGQTRIDWRWSRQQQNPLAARLPGYINLRHGVVQNVSVSTMIPLGDVWLTRGQPDTYLLSVYQYEYSGPMLIGYFNFYRTQKLWVSGETRCSRLAAVLHSPVNINMGDFPFQIESRSTAFSDARFFGDIIRMERQFCR